MRDKRPRCFEPNKPSQNAYVEFFDGRVRDECLNEHRLYSSIAHPNRHRYTATGIQPGTPRERAGRHDSPQSTHNTWQIQPRSTPHSKTGR